MLIYLPSTFVILYIFLLLGFYYIDVVRVWIGGKGSLGCVVFVTLVMISHLSNGIRLLNCVGRLLWMLSLSSVVFECWPCGEIMF